MESHQKNAGGNARIAETMFRYVRFPTDFGNFCYLSQVQQGLAIKTAVEYKYNEDGTLKQIIQENNDKPTLKLYYYYFR